MAHGRGIMQTPPHVHTEDARSSPLRAPPLLHTIVTYGVRNTTAFGRGWMADLSRASRVPTCRLQWGTWEQLRNIIRSPAVRDLACPLHGLRTSRYREACASAPHQGRSESHRHRHQVLKLLSITALSFGTNPPDLIQGRFLVNGSHLRNIIRCFGALDVQKHPMTVSLVSGPPRRLPFLSIDLKEPCGSTCSMWRIRGPEECRVACCQKLIDQLNDSRIRIGAMLERCRRRW